MFPFVLENPARGADIRRRAAGIALLAPLSLLLTLGCKPKAAPTTAAADPAEVTVSRPLRRPITDAIELTGTTTALEFVDVRARVTGFLEKIHFQPKAKVKKDDLLFTIDPRPFQNALDNAKADLEARQAQLAQADFNAKKTAELVERGAGSEQERVETAAKRDSFQAAVNAAKVSVAQAQLNLDWCQVTAPIGGRISRNLIDAGNIVAADQTVLATIVNDDDIFVYFNASERDILTIRENRRRQLAAEGKEPQTNASENVKVYLGLMTEEGFPHEGVMDYVAPQLDKSTGTAQVRARFPNADSALLAGLFARVRVPLSKPYEALVVTERALGSDQGQRYLLVVNDKNIVEYRPVKVGTLENGLRVITAGLGPDDWVIVNGIQRVRPGITVKPVQVPMPVGPTVAPDKTGAKTVPATAPASKPSAP